MSTEIDDRIDLAFFTFIWVIENYGILHGSYYGLLDSPNFSRKLLGNGDWKLVLADDSTKKKKLPIGCQIQRWDFSNHEKEGIDVNFDLAILGADGVPLVTKSGEQRFHGMFSHSEWFNLIDKDALFEQKEKILPNDKFTLRCRLWVKNSSIDKSDICFARSVLGVESREFFWANKKFSQMHPRQKRSLLLQPLQKAASPMKLTLYLERTSGDDSLVFEVEININDDISEFRTITAAISLIDVNGQLCETQKESNLISRHRGNIKIAPLFRKAALLTDKHRYLLNDTLVLRCDLKFFFGTILSRIENYGYGLNTTVESWLFAEYEDKKRSSVLCSDMKIRKETSCNLGSLSNLENIGDGSESCCSFCPLKRVMECSIKEGSISDMCLKNRKKSFFVHKNILKKKSNEFKKMTGHNVATKNINLDTQCLSHLETYIDSGAVGDLKSEVISDILEASEVYKLADLKEICSRILGNYSSSSNAQEELTRPDNHQDNKLKKRIRHLIYDAISILFF